MTIERIPITSRAEWLALRSGCITASDVPAVCGEGLYGSPAKVWAEKRGMIPAQEMTKPMLRGIVCEAAVFEYLAMERPKWELRRAKVFLRDPAARLGATPDGVAVDPERPGIGVIQAKVISPQSFATHWLEDPNDNPFDPNAPASPPLAYQLQTLTESMMADAAWGQVAAMVIDGWDINLRLFDVERHEHAEKMIRSRVAEFWAKYLDTGVQPPIDPQRDEALVKALHPKDDGSEIDLSGDNELPELVDGLTKARADKSDAEKREKVSKTAIADKIGAAAFARLADGRRISHKTQHRKAYEVAASEFRVMKVLAA